MGQDHSGSPSFGGKALFILGVVLPLAVAVLLTCAGVITW